LAGGAAGQGKADVKKTRAMHKKPGADGKKKPADEKEGVRRERR